MTGRTKNSELERSDFDPDSSYTYDYDEAGRLIEVDNAGTPGVPNVVLNYGYDAGDNLTTVTDTVDGLVKGTETFTYDELDRVTSITQSGDGVADKRVDYGYDAASQMTSVDRYNDLDGTNLIAESNYTFDNGQIPLIKKMILELSDNFYCGLNIKERATIESINNFSSCNQIMINILDNKLNLHFAYKPNSMNSNFIEN